MADGSVIIEAILDTANVPKQIGNLKNAIKGVTWDDISKGTDKAQALSAAFKSAGTSCTAMLTVPIMAAGKQMTQMSWEFDDAMAKVSTIADTSQVPLDDLRKQILDLSDQTGISANEIADNVYNAISAGQDTGDAVAFVEKATRLATAGFADSASALDVMSTVMNAYGLEAEEAARVSDVLIQTQNKGRTTVGELSASMGKAIPTASAFNVNLENLAAAYATTTANGIATADSTTYINAMIKELGDSGSDVGKIIQDELGMSFAEAMASGMSLGDVLNVLNEHGEETGQTMYDMFGSAEAASAAETLASGNAQQFTDNLAAMNDAAGLTDESFEKMQTTTFNLNKAMNQVKNVMIELGGTIGQALAPAIEGFVNGVKGFSDWFKSIGPQGQQAMLAIAGIVAAIGPLLYAIGNVIAFIPQVQAGVAALSGMLGGATGATGALGGALGALAGPVGVVLAVIAALVAAVAYLWNTDEGFRDSATRAWEQVQAAISSAIDAAMPYIEQIMEYLGQAVGFVQGAVVPAVSQVLQAVVSALGAVLAVAASVMPGILETVSSAMTVIQGVFDTVCGAIVAITTGDFTQMQAGIGSVMSGIQGIFSGIWSAIAGIVSGAVGAIGSALGFPGLDSAVRGAFEAVKSAITNPIETARGIVQSAVSTISSVITGANLQLPHIKVPHFNIDGGVVPWGIGGQGRKPTISIDWYAKGGVFDSAQIIGVGEAGREAALPLNDNTYSEIGEGIIDNMKGLSNDPDKLAGAIVRALVAAGFGTTIINLDGRQIATAMAGHLDRINGERVGGAARGWAL